MKSPIALIDLMYSRHLVILLVNENGTAERVGIFQISNLFLCLFLITQSIHISAALKVQQLWDLVE